MRDANATKLGFGSGTVRGCLGLIFDNPVVESRKYETVASGRGRPQRFDSARKTETDRLESLHTYSGTLTDAGNPLAATATGPHWGSLPNSEMDGLNASRDARDIMRSRSGTDPALIRATGGPIHLHSVKRDSRRPDRRGQAPKGTGGMPRRHQQCRRGRLRYVRGSCPTNVDPGMPAQDPGN